MRKFLLQFYRALVPFKGKFRLGKLLFRSFIDKNYSFEFKAHQHIKYKIPNTIESLGIELLINGVYEKDVVTFLKDHVKAGEFYFDVGANIGALGLPIKKNNPGIKYIGFEASPNTFEYLKYNFSENKIENYELHNFLVHEEDRQLLKFYQAEKYGESSMAPTFTEEYIHVDSISLDSFCKTQQIHRINWIKVDVQGFELFVFKGLKQLLIDKKVENILFEFEHWAEEWAGVEIGAAQQYLIDIGYELFDLGGKKLTGIITYGETMIWARPA